MGRSRARKTGFVLVGGGLLTALLTVLSQASQGSSMKIVQASDTQREPVPESAIDNVDADLEELTLPVVSEEVASWTATVQDRFEGDPQFHAVEINDARTEVTVWWHGVRTAELDEAASVALEVPVRVAATRYSPGELESAVDRLFANPDLGVSYAAPRPDGSGLDVSADARTVARAASVETQVSRVAGVPVKVTREGVSGFQNRQYDTFAIGGANYWGSDGQGIQASCSTGFAVRNLSGNTGLLTAAHCGPVGREWGPINGNTYYIYGSVTARYAALDMAVISINGTQPYFYTGAFNSGSVAQVDGTRNPPVGAEICYSGSYTGLVCGSQVTNTNATWQLSGVGQIQGLRTNRSDGTPVAGNGDSGGPGYWLTNENGTLKRYAAAIVSAGPNGTTQNGGCPGLEADRICGSAVLAGKAWDLNGDTPWNVQRIP